MNLPLADRMQEISCFYVMELLQRAKQLEAEGKDVVHMEIGEPDFPTPPAVLEAGCRMLADGQVKYTPAAGLPALRAAIADFYRSRYGVELDPARVFVTPGASGALLLALGISLNPGQELIMADPCYPCNDNFVRLLGGIPRHIPVDAGSGYHLYEAAIREHWRPQTLGVLVASPSNPTGTVISGQALRCVLDTTLALGGAFYSDEIYHGLVYGENAVTALQFSDEVFVVNSFSKYFGMTGWRVGWLVVPERFIQAADRLAQNIFISAPSHSQYAALASFGPDNLAELERRRSEFEARRDFLHAKLTQLGFGIAVKPQGAFYIYADCSRFTDDSFRFAQALLEQEGVAVTPGKDFGRYAAERYIRFAYTASIDRMSVAINRLERFLCR